VFVASAVLVLSAPGWIAVAAAIRAESPGPILFRATRVGRHRSLFSMFKFRKMHDTATGDPLTRANDERFTRIGKFLARSKFDELPQLLNVVRGDMSLVGPRPEDPKFVSSCPEDFDTVLTVRPGITGLAQIRYRNEHELFEGAEDPVRYYKEVLMPKKLMLDKYYARHQSWQLDVRILLWTMIALVRTVYVRFDPRAGVSFSLHGPAS
jgi:lipopolysaccharide/colanic/teichoic acid biosynthesis glycosyltransferase